ncbi:MAG: hypothetical protein IID31_07805 [Planctomycetes bacterium]|nr:hypothetical protein [Planctomycetota bacterium]
MSYDIDVYRAVVLARILEDGLYRKFIERATGYGDGGISAENEGIAQIRAYLKSLMLALYATHGDLTRQPRIGLWMGFEEGALLPLPYATMSVLEDDLGYVASDAERRRCYFNLSALRANQVTTDPDLFAAYYQIATPERVAAVCRADAGGMRERLTLQALFAMGGRPDIEMLADIACLDVADVTAAMSTYGRLGAIIRCEETGVFEINYELLRAVDMEAEQ